LERGTIKAKDEKYKNPSVDFKATSIYGDMESNFLVGSKAQGAYWGRKHEMFARAFESYIATKLEKSKAKNTYLCEEAGNYTKWAKMGKNPAGTIYPVGKEKEAIDKAFDELFESLKSEDSKHLLKALME